VNVLGGLTGGVSILFIVFALFTPAYSFLNAMDDDKAAQKKLNKQIVIFGSIVMILCVITVVLAILTR